MGRVFLIGMMGAGKTKVGTILAQSLKLSFFDTDACIEKKAGVPIKDYFQCFGESSFRKLEKEILELLIRDHTKAVIATGGGIVLDSENRDLLSKSGQVIYLRCTTEQLLERLNIPSEQSKRPLLVGEDADQKLAQLNHERNCFYESCAHLKIEPCADPFETACKISDMLLSINCP